MSYLEKYLQTNKIQVKLSVYYSGMSEYVVNMYKPYTLADGEKRGELITDARGSTLAEALDMLEPVCKALLEAEADRPWKKSVL